MSVKDDARKWLSDPHIKQWWTPATYELVERMLTEIERLEKAVKS